MFYFIVNEYKFKKIIIMDNKTLKENGTSSREDFLNIRTQCITKLSPDNIKDGYVFTNNLLEYYDKAIRYSENVYMEKDGLYTPFFNETLRFNDSKSAKLYDTLVEFFGDSKSTSEILTVINMIQCFSHE